MIFNWEDLGFSVKMTDGTHLDTSCCNAKGGVLYRLDFTNARWGSIWEPDRGCVGEDGTDESLKGDYNGFFLLAPGGSSERFKDVKTWGGSRY